MNVSEKKKTVATPPLSPHASGRTQPQEAPQAAREADVDGIVRQGRRRLLVSVREPTRKGGAPNAPSSSQPSRLIRDDKVRKETPQKRRKKKEENKELFFFNHNTTEKRKVMSRGEVRAGFESRVQKKERSGVRAERHEHTKKGAPPLLAPSFPEKVDKTCKIKMKKADKRGKNSTQHTATRTRT